jgi:hypothetical protein
VEDSGGLKYKKGNKRERWRIEDANVAQEIQTQKGRQNKGNGRLVRRRQESGCRCAVHSYK